MAAVTVKGLNGVLKNLKRAGKDMRMAVGAGIYSAGDAVMELAKKKVPIDTSALHDSGYVTLPAVNKANAAIELGFGGSNTPYATRIHEDTSLSHPNGGEAKFLENSLNEKQGGLKRIVTRRTNKAFDRGGRAARGRHPTSPE